MRLLRLMEIYLGLNWPIHREWTRCKATCSTVPNTWRDCLQESMLGVLRALLSLGFAGSAIYLTQGRGATRIPSTLGEAQISRSLTANFFDLSFHSCAKWPLSKKGILSTPGTKRSCMAQWRVGRALRKISKLINSIDWVESVDLWSAENAYRSRMEVQFHQYMTLSFEKANFFFRETPCCRFTK